MTTPPVKGNTKIDDNFVNYDIDLSVKHGMGPQTFFPEEDKTFSEKVGQNKIFAHKSQKGTSFV
jgi:hypothetical protein